MVQMSGGLRPQTPTEIGAMSDFDKGLAGGSIIMSIFLGIALDYGHWWLGIFSSLATLLMAGVFARRHILKGRERPVAGGI